jgi:hypothetical protein
VTLKTLLLLLLAFCQDPKDAGKGTDMNYGPFLSSTVSRTKSEKDADILAFKAITIKVGKDAAICYDTDLLRMAGAWTGGFLDLSFTHMATSKGLFPTRPGAAIKFATKVGPGWGKGDDFKDPRPQNRGPLPKDWAQYKGLFLDGDTVVLSYTVGSVPVLEMPGFLEAGSATAFTRTFNVGPSDTPLQMLVFDDDQPAHVDAGLAAAPGTAKLEISGKATIHLSIPAHAAPIRFMVLLWNGAKGDLSNVRQIPDLSAHCKGGPARWAEPVVTKGVLGKDEGPLAVDTLTLPDDNPWKSWMRTSALDFFSDGRAALATWSGDVWICSGIDASLEKLTWKRFATGLYEPLGLKIVDDVIYVLGRDQITRLRDLNGDGEADSYETFCNLGVTMASYHAFHYDLQTDREGNFYYFVGGNHVEPDVLLHNCLLKVSKDGSTIESIATGFRATNGMAIGPNDEIVCADNEGNWMPAERFDWITKKGGFYGFVSDPAHTNPSHPAPKRGEPEPPLCWIPKPQDNSSGGQVWVPSDKWGPLQGHLLHTSYGTASLFHVLVQNAGGVLQGGVVQFPNKFATGIMRAKFNPADGELYVTGLRGWQTAGVRDGAFQRVRVTGKPFRTVIEMAVTKAGIALTFSDPLDRETATDSGSYAVQQWNYEVSAKYGSPDFSVADPKKKGRDTIEVASATLSADGKTVLLGIPGLKPVMQMGVKMRIRAADGSPLPLDLYLTINKVPQ